MAERLGVGVAARLSRYLQVLTQARKMGKDRISSQEIAEYTNINATQIRRDLSGFGKFGKRGSGLFGRLAPLRDPQDPPNAGSAQHRPRRRRASRCGPIASSPIFAEHGITIAAVFDNDAEEGGNDARGRAGERTRRPEDDRRERRSSSECWPSRRESAQDAADRLVDSGVKIVFNYTQALDQFPLGRSGAHLQSRCRVALRALLPPDLSVGGTGGS